MNGQEDKRGDYPVDLLIGSLLRRGVLCAASLVLLGGIIYLFHQGFALPDYKVFRGEPPELRHIWGIIRSAFSFHGEGLIQLGLLALIATPIARVLLSIFIFLRQRDKMYVVITCLVLVVLSYSLFYGR